MFEKNGGRPDLTVARPTLEENLRTLLAEFTAGDPMREGVLWTILSLRELSRRLIARGHARQSADDSEAVQTQANRSPHGSQEEDDAPSSRPPCSIRKHRAAAEGEYILAGEAVISSDTKKKELLGNFHRPGETFTQQIVETVDHDFPSASHGQLIPHGSYDIARNRASIPLNTSHDTAELCCDSIALGWKREGRAAHPQARRLLAFCDGGGSNRSTQYLFQEDLQRLTNRLGLKICIAHDTPDCSKHNPIEHRVFPHITRACQGVIFHSVEIAKQFIERAKTTTGLKVTVSLLDKVYETGRKYAADFKATMKIAFDDHLSPWNYRALLPPT